MVRGFDESIQLLVDNELSAAETDELLLQCEQEPEAWRRLALAFLEARAIGEAAAAWGTTSSREVTIPFQSSSQDLIDGRSSAETNDRFGGWQTVMGLVAAVAALLAIVLAWRWDALMPRDSGSPSTVAESGGGSLQQETRPAEQLPLAANEPQSLGDLRAERSQPWVQPVSWGAGSFSERVSPKTRMEWLRRGIWIDETPQFHVVEKGGERYALPESKLNVTYVGDLVYQ